MEKADAKTATSDFQKDQIEKLNQLLKQQKAEIDRLRNLLKQAGTGNIFPVLLFFLHCASGFEITHIYFLLCIFCPCLKETQR